MLVGFSIPRLAGLEILGLTDLGVPGLESVGDTGLAGLAVPGIVRLTVPGLDGVTGESGLSPSSPLMTGWDNRWAFGSTDGTSKSTPLTTALL